MAITVYKQKTSKSWNGEEFTKLRPETESQNSGDHELWNHEMRGSPVYCSVYRREKLWGIR